jgi:uncharacterized membrane protein
MILLILGLILWAAAHFFQRVMPEARARMGDKGKGVVAVVIIVSMVLMVVGYRSVGDIYVWSPPSWGMHLTDLLMVIAVVLIGLGSSQSRLRGALRHPMLIGIIVWAVAHLLVNGDMGSIVLFGGMFVWAKAQIIMINRSSPDWQRPEPGNLAGDVKLAIISAVIFAAIAGVHYWLGYPVFPG